MAKTKTKNVLFENARFIVSKFCKLEGLNWGREVKISKQLLQKYPEISFWETLDLSFKLNSLAWFVNGEGEALLKKKYTISNLDLPESPKYEMEIKNPTILELPKNYQSDIRGDFSKQTKTLKDFLK